MSGISVRAGFDIVINVREGIPDEGTRDAVDGESEKGFHGVNGVSRILIVDARDGNGWDLTVNGRGGIDEILKHRDGFALVTELEKGARKRNDRGSDLLGCQASDIAEIIVVEEIPRCIVGGARLRQAIGGLKSENGISCRFVVNAACTGSGNGGIEKGHRREKVLQDLNAFSRIAERENAGEELGDILQTKSLAFQFVKLLDGVVNAL